jgi:hypothetical protein
MSSSNQVKTFTETARLVKGRWTIEKLTDADLNIDDEPDGQV